MSKKTRLLALLLALCLGLSLLAGCNRENSENSANPTNSGSVSPSNPVEVDNSNWDGAYIDADSYRAYIINDLEQMVTDIADQLTASQTTAVNAALDAGKNAIYAAGTVAAVLKAYDDAYAAILNCVPLANGIKSFSSYTPTFYEDRTEMLAALEAYAYRTGINGLSLFENGSTNLYSERLVLGTENYIPGYGFGTLTEGAITADLEYESNPAWKRYYHTLNSKDPGTLNVFDADGSEVSDFFAYISANYYDTFMNDTKDGYVWVPELAKTMPEAVNDDDGNGTATKWRFEVRTGADGLKYSTLSTIPSRAAFNNRPVELEDYITPYKLLLTQSNGLFRGSEMANKSTDAVVGVKAFYNATANGFNENLWDSVGIKAYEENGKSYLEFEFVDEQTPFFAMYYMVIYGEAAMPIPQEFIDLVTLQNYLGYNLTATETPMDNALSLGAYNLESWIQDQEIVYKKNPNFVFADTKYNIEGVHFRILPAMQEDNEAAFNEFLAGHTDAASIPQTRLNEYRSDPRARKTTGSVVFKLNMNATDAETWEYLFGEDGVITQTPKSEYWEVKPALGNAHFRQGLQLSIDRNTFANARGSIASIDFLSTAYMSDPESGIAYSNSDAHKKVVAPLTEGTDGAGYSLELARDYFRVALTELEAEGAYAPGTPENPTVISIEIAWMYPTHEEAYHNEIKSFLETAFNDPSVSGGVYKLEAVFWTGNDYLECYDKMEYGQFDLGFGTISGVALNPLSFMNTLSSDPVLSAGWTLNWGTDTNDPDAYPIVWNGERYSYDAFYNAANTSAIVANGANESAVSFEYTEITKNADGSYTGSILINMALPNDTTITVTDVVCCNYERYYYGDGNYAEDSVDFTVAAEGNALKVTFTVSADMAADYATGSGTSESPLGYTGFDLYYDVDLAGNVSTGNYYSFYDYFEVG